jgi:hypothetical protein
MPLLAAAARSLDARAFDVVICSDAAIVKAIRTRPEALKLCYCHSPMRYVWDLYDEYRRSAGPLGRLGLRLFAGPLREADRRAADSVTAFIANSRSVADRIRRSYGRASVVIPPPVDVDFPDEDVPAEDFYLVVGECLGYKRHDLAIDALTQSRNLDRVVLCSGDGDFVRLVIALFLLGTAGCLSVRLYSGPDRASASLAHLKRVRFPSSIHRSS